jgi:maltose alpha-D-glucosyltransferase/alpha-amylase
MKARSTLSSADDPLWFKEAIFYELSVRAFYDSNGDGIGDFRGLIQKLDYLEDLGINAIWLLPFYPSPLRDDGYDVTDHMDVHPDYGTLADFKAFLKEAHKRDIRVIIDLILNHTSDQHPWFRRARKAKPGSRYRNYYVWSDTPDKYKEARVIMQSEESSNWTWDQEARAYYWHRFFSHQPELNYENPEVQLEIIKTMDFWLKMGVDGFRLASVPFLYEQEGTSCENLPQTHAFVKKIRKYIDVHYRGRVLIAEANLWPEDASQYFGQGDECHMVFNYPLMPRLFLSLRTEDSYPITDIVEQTPQTPNGCQWALFLRNHDEVGLEMVTEEEKDFLLKAYASDPKTKFNTGIRRRLAPMLNNDRRKIELLYTLLFSLPGTPVIYYGDEFGMGDNIYLGGRHGVRTPMQWNMNSNAGFSAANPQQLYLPVITDPIYRYEYVNVQNQLENSSSLIWWIRNAIAMRKRLNLFGQGDMKFIETNNNKVLSFIRSLGKQRVVVVANLSQFSQAATLNLSEYRDCDVTEVFSQNRFRNVGSGEYFITLGPYGYYWFQLDLSERVPKIGSGSQLPVFESSLSWERSFHDYQNRRFFERKALPAYIRKCRWFGGKARNLSRIAVDTLLPLKVEDTIHYLLLIEVHYTQKLPELYFLPLVFIPGDRLLEDVEYSLQSVVCRADIQGQAGFVMDSTYDAAFRNFLFRAIQKKQRFAMDDGVLEFNASILNKLQPLSEIQSRMLKADQSNTAFIYNDRYFFKIYRRVEREINPDMELIRFLSEHTRFANSPRYLGSVEYRDKSGNVVVLGLMQTRVEHQGEAWIMATDSVGRFFERVVAGARQIKLPPLVNKPLMKFEEAPQIIQDFIGRGFYERVVRLGQRTAEMHLALASDTSRPEMIPEPFSANYQRAYYSSLRKLVRDRFHLLRNAMDKIPHDSIDLAQEVLTLESAILEAFREIYETSIQAVKTRIHGDYHLGQVLFTGNDFVIIDFEGEPGFSFSERRLKKSPLKDVAGMMRSFHYAAFGKILLNENYRQRDRDILDMWAEQWQHYISRFFLRAYMERLGQHEWSATDDILLRTFLLEKAIYELGYELNGRPDWVSIPLRGIRYHVERYKMEKEAEKKTRTKRV